MKRNVFYALIAFLSLGLFSCSNTDEPMTPISPSEVSDESVHNDSKVIADLITSIPLTEDIVNEVFSAVTDGLENGIEESYYFADILSESSTKSATRSNGSESKLGSEIRRLLNTTRSNSEIDADILEYGDYQIYWPYSEDWDGKTKPVITFVPEDDSQLWNYAYKQTENGIETIIVDEEFMEKNPVWIINKADIPYDELPNFNNNEFSKDGIYYCPRKTISSIESTNNQNDTRAAGEPVYTVYLGRFMSKKNYDSAWGGGSEFAIQMGAIENMVITSQEQLRATDPSVTYIRVTRSRKDVKNSRWKDVNAVLSSDWQPNENNAGFCIYEEDQGGTKYWDMTLSMKIKGIDIPFTLKMPYGSGDDLVYKTVYSRNFIFSTNNLTYDKDGNEQYVEHTAGQVYWTLPFKIGKTIL